MSRAGRPSERLKAADEEAQRVMREASANVRGWVDENLALGGACDFCARLFSVEPVAATWRTTAPIEATMSLLSNSTNNLGTATLPLGFDEEWAACAACDAVVALRDPERLVEHVIKHRDVERVGAIPAEILSVVKADLLQLYRVLFALDPVRA